MKKVKCPACGEKILTAIAKKQTTKEVFLWTFCTKCKWEKKDPIDKPFKYYTPAKIRAKEWRDGYLSVKMEERL